MSSAPETSARFTAGSGAGPDQLRLSRHHPLAQQPDDRELCLLLQALLGGLVQVARGAGALRGAWWRRRQWRRRHDGGAPRLRPGIPQAVCWGVRRHGLLCAVEAAGGLMFLGDEDGTETWLYEPRAKKWTRLRPGGQPPTVPFDHGHIASDGLNLYLHGCFGGPSVPDPPPGGGVTPRGALWMYATPPTPKD